MSTDMQYQIKPFQEFITDFKSTLSSLFEERNKDSEALVRRRFSPDMLQSIMAHRPLSVAIPTEFGGRGLHVKECLALLEAASYESISLTLIFGINFALYLEPLAKYGHHVNKAPIYKRFLEEGKMGGLMISEPLYGSDALSMQTSHVKEGNAYKIQGTKHWQGLTGMADFWLVASRGKTSKGDLGRDISLFHVDLSQAGQDISVEEYYNNYGLYPIPYGKNKIDVLAPEENLLVPETTGIKMLMDTLHRSRMQFPGMAMGFLRRAVEEATKYCNERLVRGNSLFQFDKVNHQIAELQNASTICSAMCYRSALTSGYKEDLALFGIEANTIKASVTDLMQNSAQTLTQLQGGNGYKLENLGARAIMDSRPFQIFEGPNEMLFAQISEAFTKAMARKKNTNLFDYLSEHELSQQSAALFKDDLNFHAERTIPQRKHVTLGRIIAKVIIAQYVLELGNQGFENGLISNCLAGLKSDISRLVSTFNASQQIMPMQDFTSDSSWFDFV